MYDVAIIGAGVVGCSIARELAKYRLRICVLEKESDVAAGTTKANSAIVHAGYDAKPGTLMGKLNVKGNRMYDDLASQLDFHLKRNGSMVLAFAEEDVKKLEELLERGEKSGVPGLRILSQQEVLAMEPAVNKEVKGALYAPTGGITCPYEFTWALGENAAANGVEFFFENGVTAIEKTGEGEFIVTTAKMQVKAGCVINAAGVYADEISKMAGAEEYEIHPRKGEYCLLDKQVGDMVKHTLFCVPGVLGKGILVTPTVDGNILIGPNAHDIKDKNDTQTTPEGLHEVQTGALKTVPGLPVRSVITSFAGLRAVSGNDFVIHESQKVKRFINVGGICSPGLTAAPAIAEYVREIVKEAGVPLIPNEKFNPVRKAIPRFRELDNAARAELIKQNPLYGRMVCRCEMITEGEIVEAIQRPCGAQNLDAVKRRVRAGMGRCQGGFCSPRIVEILSRELGMPATEVTKTGGSSYILVGNSR